MPSTRERRGVATRVRVRVARDSPFDASSLKKTRAKCAARFSARPRDSDAGREETRGWTRPSTIVAMHVGACVRIVARVHPHLLILRVPVLVVRERGGGPQDVEVLRRGDQELAVGLNLRGFPTGLHRVRSAGTGAPRASDRSAEPGARRSGLGAVVLGRKGVAFAGPGKSARGTSQFRSHSSKKLEKENTFIIICDHDPRETQSPRTLRDRPTARFRPSLAPARRPRCPRRAKPRTRPGRPCGA